MLESMDFPEPVISLAIEPKTKSDQEKLGMASREADGQEDPTFQVHTDQETGQTIIAGMGELHLEIIVDRMMREFNVEANVGKPQVAYQETITQKAEGEGRYMRQTGGRGQFGHAKIRLMPRQPGEGFVFENKIVGGAIPKEFIKPVEQGIKEALETGVLAGYPDGRREGRRCTTASYHDVDSYEMAFKIAGSMAFKDAAQEGQAGAARAGHAVEVVMPEEYMGDVIGDLNSRRGRIEGMETARGTQIDHVDACRFRRCSATRPTCARARRAAPPTRCTSSATKQAPSNVAEEVIARMQGTKQ